MLEKTGSVAFGRGKFRCRISRPADICFERTASFPVSHPYDNAEDQELLQAWEQRRDEEAFRELVARHLGMVHATAQRRTGSAELAGEVSMSVFALMARKGASMRRHPCLVGWLHRAALLEASNALRRELKHRRVMAALSDPAYAAEADEGDTLIAAAAPHLDEALERLSPSDRDAVLLRYTARLSYDAMSARMGKSADACQKQTSRALEKLAAILLRRGVALSAAALGAVITAGTTRAAPALLTGKIAAGAMQQAAGVSFLSVFHHTLHAMNTGKQIAAGTLLAASLAALPLLMQHSEASALSRQVEALPVSRHVAPPAKTVALTAPPQEPAPDSAPRVHLSASAAEADATLEMIAKLDGRQFASHELFDLVSRVLDLPVEYMPRALERILAMKTVLLQPALGVALFARWGELDPEGAKAVLSQPSFAKLHPYAGEIAGAGIMMGMLEIDPPALLKSHGHLDMDFLLPGLANVDPAVTREFLARLDPRRRSEAELKLLFRRAPENFEALAADYIAAAKEAHPENVRGPHSPAATAVQLLADRDPQRALNFALSMRGDEGDALAAYLALRRWSERDASAAMAWLNEQPEERQQRLLDGVSPALERMDVAALREFAGTGPEELRPRRFQVAAQALANRDPAAAARMAEDAPEQTRGRTWDNVAHTWAEQDKVEASEWLDALPAGSDRNHAVAGFTRQLVWEDAESAMIWAESIGDPALRAGIVERRIQVWISRDRAAAAAWLAQSGTLPEEREQALLNKKPEQLLLER